MLIGAILAIAAANAADPSSFGAGLVVGDTTGVSLGYRPTEWNAVEVGLGYDILDRGLKGSADYLQSVAVIDPDRYIRIPIYVGLGAGLGRDIGEREERIPVAAETPGIEDAGAEGRTDVSARVPIGASILFLNAPVEFFAHAVPSLRVVPDRQLDVDGALGFRYYF